MCQVLVQQPCWRNDTIVSLRTGRDKGRDLSRCEMVTRNTMTHWNQTNLLHPNGFFRKRLGFQPIGEATLVLLSRFGICHPIGVCEFLLAHQHATGSHLRGLWVRGV